MKKITKTFFVAKDGNEFKTEIECINWENRKFDLNPINFTDKQIIDILYILFKWAVYEGDKIAMKIKIEIKGENDTGRGFLFRITAQDEETKIYEGMINGYNDFELTHNTSGVIKNEWIMHCGFSLKEIYKYLDKIKYFNEVSKEPIENPKISKNWQTWKTIYNKEVIGKKVW